MSVGSSGFVLVVGPPPAADGDEPVAHDPPPLHIPAVHERKGLF